MKPHPSPQKYELIPTLVFKSIIPYIMQALEEKTLIESYKCKLKALKERMKKWEKQLSEWVVSNFLVKIVLEIFPDRIDHFYAESIDRIAHLKDMSLQRLMTELETGGNIRFEDGKPSDLWYKSDEYCINWLNYYPL